MRNTRRWRVVLALIFTLALVAASCGRDDSSSNGDSGSNGDGGGGGGEASGPATTDDCVDYQATTGVTDDAIKIGSSYPQSGLFEAFSKIARGYEAYFETLNNADGVGGRQIEVVGLDDAYESGQTQSNYQELVQSEQVFSLFGVVGTANNLAIREQQNEECVPNLFTATGSPEWGDPDQYPWTIGSIPTYNTEMAMWVNFLTGESPDATIAVVYQNDDFGKSYLDAVKAEIEGTDMSIVAEETYDPENADLSAQMTTVAASDADVLVLATTALACPGAMGNLLDSSWRPLAYISATCISSTLVDLAPPGAADLFHSGLYLMDPRDPQWDDAEGMVEFREQGPEVGLSAEDLDDGVIIFGWTLGQLLEQTLTNADAIDRQSVMNSSWALDDVELGLLIPGITVNTDGAEDAYPIETMQLAQYNGTFWELQGELFDNEGESGS